MKPALRLGEQLEHAPHRFDALHALRLLELGAGQFGSLAGPQDEPAQIVAQQGQAFAPSPLRRITRSVGVRVVIAFLGMTGPLGVLPQFYSELVQQAERQRNRAMAAFLDLFNHRLAGLFLRAADKYRLALLVQRRVATPQAGAGQEPAADDPVSGAMLALAGYGTPHLRGRMAFNEEVILYYAGLFALRNRPASGLQAILGDYLGCGVVVEQFAGRWLPVDEPEQTRMRGTGEQPAFCRLGIDTVVGAQIWDVQGYFRVVVGPLSFEQMLSLMPNAPKLAQLVDLIRAYAGVDLGFDVQIVLRREDVPTLCFHPATNPGAPRLGWNSWAKFLPASDDRRDIIIDPDQLALARTHPVDMGIPASTELT